VPLTPIRAIQAPTEAFGLGFHLVAWALGLTGIGLGGRSMVRLVGKLEDARTEALADRRRAEDSDQAKSRFLATMSHELRTPLNAILGFSQMMEQKILGPLGNPTYEEYAQDIRVSGEHLLALVNDVLDLSKIESGRMSLSEDRVDLGDAITRTVALLASEATLRGIRLDTMIQPGLPEIRADARLIRQMLINVIANALRFTPGSGRVLVTADMDRNGGCRLAVSDTGPGIPESEIDAVLEPFRQGSNVETGARFPAGGGDPGSARAGTGLGLALVKGFIELHGGSLALTSTVGQGTTVSLRFPASRILSAQTVPN
jgi:signal transduction histidine kinase